MNKEIKLPPSLQLEAEWEDDCQGKKDYDGEIIGIRTRYWQKLHTRNM